MQPRPSGSFWRAAGLCLLLPGAGAACRGGEGREQAGAAAALKRDSAGIAIVETPGALARAPLGWTVDTEPELQIGAVDGEDAHQLHLVRGVVGLSDGRVVVVDGGSAELRWFDAEGRFLHRVGGRGDGPEEFRSPRLVPYAVLDSLLVYDTQLRGFTLLSADGEGLRTFPPDGLPADRLSGIPLGGRPEGVLMAEDFAPAVVMPLGSHSVLAGVRWIGITQTRVDTVGLSEVRYHFTEDLHGMLGRLIVPFATRPSASVSADGFVVTHGERPAILRFDPSGRLIGILRIDEPPRPVTDADVDAAADHEAEYQRLPASQVRPVVHQMDRPETWPAFEDLRVDDLGWVWARTYRLRGDPTSTWVVFDPDGVARGTLALPPGVDVHHIGADYILGHWRDELGVEYVRRYRLERGP